MKLASLILIVCLFAGCRSGDTWTLHSPSDNIKVVLGVEGERLTAMVFADQARVIDTIYLGMEVSGLRTTGSPVRVIEVRESTSDKDWERPWGKSRKVKDHYNQLDLVYEEDSGF